MQTCSNSSEPSHGLRATLTYRGTVHLKNRVDLTKPSLLTLKSAHWLHFSQLFMNNPIPIPLECAKCRIITNDPLQLRVTELAIELSMGVFERLLGEDDQGIVKTNKEREVMPQILQLN
ncbi:hypothetical protein HAX54_048274, partial [Datura stramonium]|nr:hypothetical protein [Datura stramonium]